MSTSHTPEPWHLLDDRWLAAGTSPGQPYIADFSVSSSWRPTGTTEANARRAWLCVNACAGMANPAAEIAALQARVSELSGNIGDHSDREIKLREALRGLLACFWEGRPKKNVRRDYHLMVACEAARVALGEIKHA